MLILKRPWTRQPQTVVRPAQKWLSRGMKALFLPLPNGMIYEAVTRRLPDAFVANPIPRQRGIYNRMSSSAPTAQFNTVFGMPQNGVTIVTFNRCTSTVGSDRGAMIKVGSASTGYGIGYGSNTGVYWDTFGPGGVQYITCLYEAVAWKVPSPAVTVPSNGIEYYCAAARINTNNTGGIYAPGLGAGTWTASTPIAPATNTYVGGYQANRYTLENEFLAAALFASVLTDSEIDSLHREYLQLIEDCSIYIPAATAAATAPTITALSAISITATSAQPQITYA